MVYYRVRSKKELSVIIKHFDHYPLCTSKYINYLYFREILKLSNSKIHKSAEGFLTLVSLINKLNKPLSDLMLKNFSNLGELPKLEIFIPNVNKDPDLNPYWISGFITGEGSFTYFTRTRENSKKPSFKKFF